MRKKEEDINSLTLVHTNLVKLFNEKDVDMLQVIR